MNDEWIWLEHPEPLRAWDKTYTPSKIDISGSNETMQNALASMIKVWRIFEIFFTFHEFQKLELLYFSSDLGEIFLWGVTLGREQHRIFLKWLRLFFDRPN